MRKLEGTDFVAAAKLRRSGIDSEAWVVGKYELEGDTIVDTASGVSECVSYKPLEEVPDLFFRFARLYEAEDFATSALEWVREFGLPNRSSHNDAKDLVSTPLAREISIRFKSSLPEGAELAAKEIQRRQQLHMENETANSPYTDRPDLEGTQGNRPSMTIKELRQEAMVAWETLAHYEAYVNHEPERALYLPDGSLNPEYELVMNSRPMDFVRWIVMAGALHMAEGAVTHMVTTHCRFKASGKKDRQGQGSRWAWKFHDLYGAMYLQMMWVMERGVTIGRCKWCNNTLSARGPKGNKSGKKKMFCNDAHRMAYNRARAGL